MAYERQMTGEGFMYRERQRVIVRSLDCGDEIVTGSLEVHQQKHHGVEEGGIRQWETSPQDGDLQTYRMDLPNMGVPWA